MEQQSRRAFAVAMNAKDAIDAISQLKGVGPATATALLTAFAPSEYGFAADESMQAVPGLGPLQYTPKYVLQYLARLKAKAAELNTSLPSPIWTAHRVELALWVSHWKAKLPAAGAPASRKRSADDASGQAPKRQK